MIIAKSRPAIRKRQLPKNIKIHLVFNVSLLYLVSLEIPLQTTFHYETKKKNEFEVEIILTQEGQRYLVKWKGYKNSENIWEPKTNLQNCQEFLRQW